MATTVGGILIDLSLNTAKFAEGINKTNQQLGNFQRQFSNVGRQIGNIGKMIMTSFAAYLSADMFKSFIDAAAEAEDVSNRLRFALEVQGYSWSSAKIASDAFAGSIQENTRFSDEQARKSLAQMTMYTKEYAKAEMGVKLAMDMSIRTGMDLQTSTTYIGMAMTGNVERLGRYIPQLKNLDDVLGKNATMADKAAYAMSILQKMFGGAAQNDIKTYAGAMAQFKNAWDEFKETIGDFLIGPGAGILKWATEMMRQFTDMAKILATPKDDLAKIDKEIAYLQFNIRNIKQLSKEYGNIFGEDDIKLIEEYTEKISILKQRRQELIDQSRQKISKETVKDVLPVGIAKKKTIWEAYGLSEAEYEAAKIGAERAKDWLKRYIEVVIEGGEIEFQRLEQTYIEIRKGVFELRDILVPDIAKFVPEYPKEALEADIKAIGRYAEEVYDTLYEIMRITSEDIQKIVELQEKQIEDNISALGIRAQEVYDELYEIMKITSDDIIEEQQRNQDMWINFAERVGSTWTQFTANMMDSTKSMSENITTMFKSLVDSVIQEMLKLMVNWAIFGSMFGATGIKSGSPFGGLLGLFGMRKMASGGIVNKPTFAMIGEKGPEAIVPLNKYQGNAGTTVNYFHINALDPQSWADFVRRNPGPVLREFHKDARANGPMRQI